MPTKAYSILNIAEVTPTENPDAGFLYLFPRGGKWWSLNSAGQEEVLGSVNFDEITSIPSWSSLVTYSLANGDITVLHDDKVWKLVAAESINEEPGVSADWDEVDFSALSHVQNSDYKLGRHVALLDGGGTKTFDLTAAAYAEKNYFLLDTDGLDGNGTYTLQTVSGGLRKQGEFTVYVAIGAAYTITFVDNANQKIGIENLELTDGDWAKFEGDVNGKTTLIASNKKQAGGTGLTPFDQGLNTTDNVQFNAVKVTTLAAAATEQDVAGLDDQGNVIGFYRINIKDVVQTEFIMYDVPLAAYVLYKSENGVLVGTAIPTPTPTI